MEHGTLFLLHSQKMLIFDLQYLYELMTEILLVYSSTDPIAAFAAFFFIFLIFVGSLFDRFILFSLSVSEAMPVQK